MRSYIFFAGLLIINGRLFCASESSESVRSRPYEIVRGSADDESGLKELYRAVAAQPGRLARSLDEITDAYIHEMLMASLQKGVIFVAKSDGKIVGSFLKYRSGPQVFSHVLANGSILVHPDYEGMGIGSKLIDTLLAEVKNNMSDILRVDLVVRESNHRARELYKRKGFVEEGKFDRKIRAKNGKLEADIPMVWFNLNFKDVSLSD